MPIAYLFWLIVILWLLSTVGALVPAWSAQRANLSVAGSLFALIAIVLLGWATFGEAVK